MFAEPAWTMYYKPNYTREQVAPRATGRPRKAPAKVAEGQFDPDELSRRLFVVLAEQKAHADRRQRARGELSNCKDGLGPSSGTRHRNGPKQARETRQKLAEPPADLITALKRSESAKHKPSHAAPTQTAPDETGAQPEAYHHVPQEAAKQFTRTTTVEHRPNGDLVHKLSKQALKFHTEGPRTVRPGAGSETALSPAELTRALQQTQSHRDRLLERNQFQRTRILEEAARLDHDTQLSPRSSSNKHTFESELARILPGGAAHPQNSTNNNKHARRNSTGNTDPFPTNNHPASDDNPHNHNHNHRHSLIAPNNHQLPTLDEDTTTTTTPPPEELNRFPPADRARVDWTQSDESRTRGGGGGGGGPTKLLLLSPRLLRKADSLWALRGRRGSKDSEGGGSSLSSSSPVAKEKEKVEGVNGGGKGEEVESPRAAGKGGFFGRFRR